MFRVEASVRAGIAAAVLWLASGVVFAAIVWFRLYTGDVIRLLVPETIPVETWQLSLPWQVAIPLLSTLFVAAAAAFGTGRLRTPGSEPPRRVLLLAIWLVVVATGAVVGVLTGIGALIGNGQPPRLAFIAQGLPDAIAPALYWGLLTGWLPALVSLPPRGGREASPRMPWQLPAVIALVSGVSLVAATAVVTAEARSAGLQGEPPSSVQEPQPDPIPTGTPPPMVAPGTYVIDPSWCTPSQLLLAAGGADAATGHRTAAVSATNVGQDPCVLPDYPDVAFADEHGVAVEAAVRHGGGFMTDDPGPAALTLQPGDMATAFLAWDATDGRTVIPTLYLAPYAGAERQFIALAQQFDITAASEVAVTAWAYAGEPVSP
jgi:hypothetical protein